MVEAAVNVNDSKTPIIMTEVYDPVQDLSPKYLNYSERAPLALGFEDIVMK